MTYIYYFIDTQNEKFYFFKDRKSAEVKAVEIGIDSRLVDLKELKKYYGTVWLAVKWTEKEKCAYAIFSHYKDAEKHKENGYKVEKFVLIPYKEWNKQFEEPEEKTEELKEILDKLDNSDFTEMFDKDNIKRRSPF